MDWMAEKEGGIAQEQLPVHVFGRKPTRRTVNLSSEDSV